MLDFIIVGQGIAGSMLSWFLLKANQKILVLDRFNPSSATYVASGITNPITGRRFVKTWLADDIIPFAENTYNECERIFNERFLQALPIIRLFDSIKAQNDWSTRCATPEYLRYLKNESIVYLDKQKIKNDFGGFEINGGSRLDTGKFLTSYRTFLKQKSLLSDEAFDSSEFKTEAGSISYKNIKARKIIFCEGAAALQNPYFKFLPFMPAKGECLTVKIPNFYGDRIISAEAFIMPLINKDEYYIGSTHQWNFHDALPSEEGKNELMGNLSAILNAHYEIIGQSAAIRPTVKDRRPLIGFHPEHENIGIFNGMGTKGISLAPYFAKHFVRHMIEQTDLMKEIDIRRFLS